jgi:hypothetical protein
MVYSNNVNNLLNNKPEDNIFNHIYVLIFIFGLFIFVIIYVLYYYFISDEPRAGFTYFASDLLKLNPLFTENSNNVDDCITLCKKNAMCDGITYHQVSQLCTGQSKGRLRTDDTSYVAWVKKDRYNKLNIYGEIDNIKQGFLIASIMESENRGFLKGTELSMPPLIDQYSFSFKLTISDWYQNYSYWRHIFHKGSPINKNDNSIVNTIQYKNWQEIVDDLPDQNIGVWLTPFQNNIRVAITTIHKYNEIKPYKDANAEICNYKIVNQVTDTKVPTDCWLSDVQSDFFNPGLENTKSQKNTILSDMDIEKLEYLDITDIETNKPLHFAITFNKNEAQVYVNGNYKLTKILNGRIKWNNGDVYINNPIKYSGKVENIRYLPGTISSSIVKKLYQDK